MTKQLTKDKVVGNFEAALQYLIDTIKAKEAPHSTTLAQFDSLRGNNWYTQTRAQQQQGVMRGLPTEDKCVLAVITHQGCLGLSVWREVVAHNGKEWISYAGSDTFSDGEQVSKWVYCDEVLPITQ